MKLEPWIRAYLSRYGEIHKGILIALINNLTGVSKSSIKTRINKMIFQSKISEKAERISLEEQRDISSNKKHLDKSYFTIQSEDNITHIKSNITENQHKKFLEHTKKSVPLIVKDLKDKIKDIEDKIVNRYDPLDVLGYMTFTNLFENPYNYSETTFKGLELIPETIQNIILRNERDSYEKQYRDSFKEIEETCSEYIQLLQSYIIFSSIHDKTLNDLEKEIYFLVIQDFLFSRGDAYSIHYKEVAQELFSQINNVLSQKGFTIDQYYETLEEIERQINHNINEPSKRVIREWKNYRSKMQEMEKKLDDDELVNFAETLLKKSEARLVPFREKFAETILKGSFEIDMNGKVNQNLLELLCSNFGDNSHWNSPFDKNDTVIRPLIKCNNKYYCFLSKHLIRNVIPIMESLLTEQERNVCRYSDVKGDYLEEKVFSLMKKIFDPLNEKSSVFVNLKYPTKKNQLDALVIYENSLLLIEVKNKKKRTIAGKNINELFNVLESDFQAHINEAFEQTNKALDYIKSKESAGFETPQGSLKIRKEDYTSIYQIVISLESFSPLTTKLKLIKAWNSKMISGNTHPWILTVYDLMILCDWLKAPEEFLNYLNHRIENEKKGDIYSRDEIDYLGYFLAFGNLKQPANLKKSSSIIEITGFSTHIDRYYDHVIGKIILDVKNLTK